jgi:hypothetical protein
VKAKRLAEALFDRSAVRRKRTIAGVLAVLFVAFCATCAPAALAAAPVVTIEPANGITYHSAHVEGEVNPADHETFYHFEYVSQVQFEAEGFAAAGQNNQFAGFGSVQEGAGSLPVEADLFGLRPGTTYHVRLLAENTEGEKAEEAAPTFTTDAVAKPTVSNVTVSSVTSAAAHLEGTVNAGGSGAGEAAGSYRFHCEPSCPGIEGEHEFGAEGFADGSDHTVEVDATGLAPNKTYKVTLITRNAQTEAEGNPVESAQAAEFTTEAILPELETEAIFGPTETTATLTMLINPHNSELSECHFLYGVGAPSGHEVPCEVLPAPNESFQTVTAEISDLATGAEYKFKLLAADSAGSVELEGVPFETISPAPPEGACPNEERRQEQQTTFLPDCRAYEQVSPTDKNGGDVTAGGDPSSHDQLTVAAADGNAVAYASRAGFAGSRGSGKVGLTQYLARRSTAGWTSGAITPTPAPESLQIFAGSTEVSWFSKDLTNALVWAYDLPAASDDVINGMNYYREELGTGALQTITQSQADPISPVAFLAMGPIWGASADDKHVALVSRTRLLPEAEPGVPNAYDWSDGNLRLAGILPDGSVPTEGSDIQPMRYRNTVSADGARIAFISPPLGASQLYMRIDHARTVWISEPEGSFSGTPEGVQLRAVSADGRRVLFTTTSPLLNEDANSGPDLYLYTDGLDPAHESNLTLISHSGEVTGGGSGESPVVGMSEDGSKVYFFEKGLHAGLRLWDNGTVRTLNTDVQENVTTGAGSAVSLGNSLGASASAPGMARVSKDGNTLAFLSDSTMGNFGVRGLTGQVTHGHIEFYVYDARGNTLNCVSCPVGTAATSNAEIMPTATHTSPTDSLVGIRPQFLSPDGHYAFFSTVEGLLPQDVNGLSDVYEWNLATRKLSLVSTANGADGAWFLDASATGGDVFFVTRQQLVGWDQDSLLDVYDARRGGGFPEPVPGQAPCEGETCQGSASTPPSGLSASTGSFSGPGNPKPRRPKHPRRHHHRHHHRTAHRNQGGGR